MEKYSNNIVQDKNRASEESSRDSFSSMSRSSSFSSVDCNINNTTNQELDHIVFPVTPSRDSLACQSRQSVDLRDVVKDSMYKLNNPIIKDNGTDHVVDYRESLDALAKFKEASWHYNVPRELSRSKSYQLRDGSLLSVSKDCRRFSYDRRETNRLSFQQRDNSKDETSMQPEELTRRFLDSRESLTRSLRNSKNNDDSSADRGLVQSRPPSVVAKLMGLEVFPDFSSTNSKQAGLGLIRTSGVEDLNTFGLIKMYTSSRISPVDEFRIDDRRNFRNNIPESTCRKNAAHATEVKSVGRHTRNIAGLTKQRKSSGSTSPKVPQKRAELDRRSRPPALPMDSSKLRKQSVKQVSESSSAGGRRSKYTNICDVKGESKKLSYGETRVSHEVVSIPEYCVETNNMQSPISIQKKSSFLVREHDILGPEYASPVSVLDDAVYMEDSPSPVKHKLKTLQDNTDQGIKDEWQAPDDIPNTLSSGFTSITAKSYKTSSIWFKNSQGSVWVRTKHTHIPLHLSVQTQSLITCTFQIFY